MSEIKQSADSEKCPTCNGYHLGGCHRKAVPPQAGDAAQAEMRGASDTLTYQQTDCPKCQHRFTVEVLWGQPTALPTPASQPLQPQVAQAGDDAERVAQQITESGYLRTADIAALIRTAMEEREQRWPSVVNTFSNRAEKAESENAKLREGLRELADASNSLTNTMLSERKHVQYLRLSKAISEAEQLLIGKE